MFRIGVGGVDGTPHPNPLPIAFWGEGVKEEHFLSLLLFSKGVSGIRKNPFYHYTGVATVVSDHDPYG